MTIAIKRERASPNLRKEGHNIYSSGNQKISSYRLARNFKLIIIILIY